MDRLDNRHVVGRLLAVCAAIYGVYTLLYVPPLMTGRPAPLLLVAILAQGACAVLVAVGLWTNARWAAGAILAWGGAFVFAQLVEGPVLGLEANLRAIAAGTVGLVVAIIVATYVRAGTLRA